MINKTTWEIKGVGVIGNTTVFGTVIAGSNPVPPE